ncbi:MAG: hypothetical protein PHS49_08050 [Candidatus Gracilibacteria bacterium]|nr:hypothetical protein [Candidatus Gracilibacteria bacterium]
MNKIIYISLFILLVSCKENISVNDIESINLDNNDIITDTSTGEFLIDQTTDKEIDQLIDILFDTSNY